MAWYGIDHFGGSQNSFYQKLTKTFKSKDLKVEIANLKDIIRKYKPEYTDKDILNLAKNIKAGGCTYVSTVNMIFEQLGYDEKLFYLTFGFNMKNPDGSLNFDPLIVDLYTFLLDKCQIEINGYVDEKHFDNILVAAKNLLGKEFEKDETLSAEGKAMIALADAGYSIDGEKYTKFIKGSKTYIGDFKKVAKEIDPNLNVKSIEELKEALQRKRLAAAIIGYNQSEKLTGTLVPQKHLDLWLNYYFQEKGINLEVITKQMSTEDLFDNQKFAADEGTITVSVMASAKFWMHNGKRNGWFNFCDVETTGHAMSFRGLTPEGDIRVSSWGEIYVIPKEYAGELLTQKNIIRPRKKEEKQTFADLNNEEFSKTRYSYNEDYSINEAQTMKR